MRTVWHYHVCRGKGKACGAERRVAELQGKVRGGGVWWGSIQNVNVCKIVTIATGVVCVCVWGDSGWGQCVVAMGRAGRNGMCVCGVGGREGRWHVCGEGEGKVGCACLWGPPRGVCGPRAKGTTVCGDRKAGRK